MNENPFDTLSERIRSEAGGPLSGQSVRLRAIADEVDRLLAAEDALARVASLLDPHVTHDAISGRTSEIAKTHIRARDLRAALGDPR